MSDVAGLFIDPYGKRPYDIFLSEGEVTGRFYGRLGNLPNESPVFGKLFIGNGRIYGRFTRILLPSGESAPLCMEIWSSDGRGNKTLPDSTADKVHVDNSLHIMVVPSFE
jgi:serine/threonine-protein kinase